MLDFAADIWPVTVDVNQLEMALLNLTVNARDAMPKGGTLRIATANVRLDGEPGDLAGEFVRLTVADTGTGMPPDIAARVFEPFFTTKPPDKGTGLGLSQVYGFAKQCGGAATLDSVVGSGTTISLYLPRARPDASADPSHVRTAPMPTAGRGGTATVAERLRPRPEGDRRGAALNPSARCVIMRGPGVSAPVAHENKRRK